MNKKINFVFADCKNSPKQPKTAKNSQKSAETANIELNNDYFICQECGRRTSDPDAVVSFDDMTCICAQCNGNDEKKY